VVSKEAMSTIIFPNHQLWIVKANQVQTIAKLTKEAIKQHEAKGSEQDEQKQVT
jgi:hypothetical protein